MTTSKKIRKTQIKNGSLYANIPTSFARLLRIEAGDPIQIVYDSFDDCVKIKQLFKK